MNDQASSLIENFRKSNYTSATITGKCSDVASAQIFDITAHNVPSNRLPMAAYQTSHYATHDPTKKDIADYKYLVGPTAASGTTKSKKQIVKSSLVVQESELEQYQHYLGSENTQNIHGIDNDLQRVIFEFLLEKEAYRKHKQGHILYELTAATHNGHNISWQVENGIFSWSLDRIIKKTGFLDFIKTGFTISRPCARATLASILKMSESFLYSPKGHLHRAAETNGRQSFENIIPSVIDTTQGILQHIGNTYIIGYAQQVIGAIVRYRLGTTTICLPASVVNGYLSMGRHQPSAFLLNQTEIDANPTATVLYCQDVRTGIALDQAVKESNAITAADIIVTSSFGLDLAEFPWDYLEGHNIIFITAPSKESYEYIESYKHLITRVGAKSFKIYPYWLLHTAKPGIKVEEPYLAQKARYINDIERISVVLQEVIATAMEFKDFISWGQEIGLFARMKSSTPKNVNTPCTFTLSESKNEAIKSFRDVTWSHILPRTGFILICGKKGTAKTYLLLSLMRAICSGVDFLGIKGTNVAETVINYDTESMPDDFSSRLQQLKLEDFMDNKLYCIVKSNMREENPFSSFSLANPDSRKDLDFFAQAKGAGYIAVDNLTTSMGDNEENIIYTPSLVKDVLDWGKNLNTKNIGFILLHHIHENCKDSTLGEIRGSKEWFIRSHTILVLIGAEEVLASKKKYPDIVIDKCRSQGATIGIYFKACKLAGILDRTILWAHLPYGETAWQVLAHTDMNGNELEGLLCTVVDESQEAQEASTPIVSDVVAVLPRTHENLSCEERQIYDFLTRVPSASTSKVAKYLKCSLSKARPILQNMASRGIINEEGQGKARKYFI